MAENEDNVRLSSHECPAGVRLACPSSLRDRDASDQCFRKVWEWPGLIVDELHSLDSSATAYAVCKERLGIGRNGRQQLRRKQP